MNAVVIDPTPLNAIRDLEQAGNDGLLATIVNLFLTQSTELCDAIRGAVAAGDTDGLREAAHSLKSSSANVGAMRVSSLSYDLEVAGRDGLMDNAAALSDRLVLAINEANAALTDIMSSAAA